MNLVVNFAGIAVAVGAVLLIARLPWTKFLLRRTLQFSWPSTEATLSKAGVISIIVSHGQNDSSTLWDSVFQVSYLADGKPVFGYFAFRSYEIEPAEAQGLQSSWDGAKVSLRYDPRNPETFAFERKFAETYDVIYMPEFSGPGIADAPDPFELPKNVDISE